MGKLGAEASFARLPTALYNDLGPVFATVKVTNDTLPLVLPTRDGTVIRSRFRETLLGEKAFQYGEPFRVGLPWRRCNDTKRIRRA